jgi:hypothetical protein
VDSFRLIDCPSWKRHSTSRFSGRSPIIPCYPSQARSISASRTWRGGGPWCEARSATRPRERETRRPRVFAADLEQATEVRG